VKQTYTTSNMRYKESVKGREVPQGREETHTLINEVNKVHKYKILIIISIPFSSAACLDELINVLIYSINALRKLAAFSTLNRKLFSKMTQNTISIFVQSAKSLN